MVDFIVTTLKTDRYKSPEEAADALEIIKETVVNTATVGLQNIYPVVNGNSWVGIFQYT